MTTSTKGAAWVREVRSLLQELGYICWKPGNKAVWTGLGRCYSQSQDILGAFDLIAVRSDTRVLMIQVTSAKDTTHDSLASERKQKIDRLNLPLDHVLPVVMGRRPRKLWIVWQMVRPGHWSRAPIAHSAEVLAVVLGIPLLKEGRQG